MPLNTIKRVDQIHPKAPMTSALEQQKVKQTEHEYVWRRPVSVLESSFAQRSKRIKNGVFWLFCICGMMWAHSECHALDLSEGQQDMFSIFAMTAVPFLSYSSAKPVGHFFDAVLHRLQ